MQLRAAAAIGVLVAAGGAVAVDVDGRAGAQDEAVAQDEERAKPRPPNVLIIVSDDQRAGTLEVMPRTRRAFSQEGITYSNAYVTTPLCCPSRASILSGRYAHNHGVYRNGADDELDYSKTLPAVLNRLGYYTAMIGKLSNAWHVGETPPYFDQVTVKWPQPSTAEDYLADQAAEFIASGEESDEEPWMLWLGARAPHTPLLVDPEHEDSPVPAPITPGQVEADLSDKPGFVHREVENGRRALGDKFDFRRLSDQIDYEIESRRELLSLDEMVGDVFEALEDAGEERETLAFFISDNGYMAGEHGGLARKHVPYMESIRVPMMMRWPGRVPAGLDSTKLVANLDIAPTIYDAVGVDPGYTIDGRSLFSDHKREYLLTERLVGGNWPRFSGIVTRRLHYIENMRSDTLQTRSQELYDLGRDPYELENYVRDDTSAIEDELGELHALVAGARHCKGSACP